MSTRSRIGILHKDGTIIAKYCHSDGYFSWNGRLLNEHWKDPKEIQKLIVLGDMSVLGEEIGVKHDFDWVQKMPPPAGSNHGIDWDAVNADPRRKMCLFYKRDRGEKGDIGPKTYESIQELLGDREEYVYLYDEARGAWLGAQTYTDDADELVWHLLSDLAANDYEDGRDDNGENPTVRSVPLLSDEPLAVVQREMAMASDDPAARAIF